jgi:hypothetical protein
MPFFPIKTLSLAAPVLLISLAPLLLPARAWAYRPFVSTDAAVADPQEMEIELGYFTLERTGSRNTFIVPKTVLNYGLLKDLEIVGEFQVTKVPDQDARVADPGLSLKAVLKEGILQEREGIGIAVEAGPLLPSSVPGEGRLGFEGAGILSGRLASVTYHLNLGGGLDRVATRPFVTWGVIAELPIAANLRLVGEVNGESARGELPQASGLLGAIWQVPSSNLFLDAGLRRGFSRGAPDWQFTVGLTYGFPLKGW